jgi:hypothetical protein
MTESPEQVFEALLTAFEADMRAIIAEFSRDFTEDGEQLDVTVEGKGWRERFKSASDPVHEAAWELLNSMYGSSANHSIEAEERLRAALSGDSE